MEFLDEEGFAKLTEKKQETSAPEADLDGFGPDSVMTYGYCTELLVRLQNSKTNIATFDIEALKAFLSSVGDSIVAFQTDSIVKIHVHTLTPEKVLAHFGGGYIHYCGDNRHLLEIVPRLKNNIGLNLGNPERHDPKEILRTLGETGKCYYGAFPGLSNEEQAALARREDGSYNQFLTCSCTVEEQRETIERFRDAVEND